MTFSGAVRRIIKGFFVGRTDIGDYMHRWVLRTPLLQVRVHCILRSDGDRDLHDHPFDFATLLVRGSYAETRPGPAGSLVEEVRPRWSLLLRRAEDLHRLRVVDGPVWTLVLAGPYRREWGFATPEGWVAWRAYQARRKAEEFCDPCYDAGLGFGSCREHG